MAIMNKIKPAVSAVLAALLCAAALASCQLSELFGKDATTPEATDGPSGEDADIVIEDVDPVDFYSLNMADYIKIADYKGVKITVKPVSELTDEEFEIAVGSLREKNAYYAQITDRAAAEGDTLNIDFVGYMDGKTFEGGAADDRMIDLTENSGYINGFAEGLIGALPGTTVKVEVTFPESYANAPELAGKPAVFDITVNYIQGDYIVPELDDEFVAKYTGGEFTSALEYRDYYRSFLNEERVREAREATAYEIWSIIADASEIIGYPEQQVDYNAGVIKRDYLYMYAGGDMSTYAMFLQYYGITEESIRNEARDYTAQDLIFYCIICAENITLSDEEYTEWAVKIADYNGMTVAEFEEAYSDIYGGGTLNDKPLKEKVLDELYNWADITVSDE